MELHLGVGCVLNWHESSPPLVKEAPRRTTWPAYARLEQEPRSPSARFRHRFSDCQSYQKVSSDEGSCKR